jgi:polysaccharide biosynthesis/export protein
MSSIRHHSIRSTSIRSGSLLLSFLCLSCGLLAQTRQQPSGPISDLARQNMARVAATAGQLVVVLHKDPGLMVELKRWIAKDATDHGQLISDSDLAEEAIFDRLERDVAFRAVATALVQKYGYLQPTVDPDSELGKQQDLLMKERVKWVAQEEEEERAKERQEQTRALQQTRMCDARGNYCASQGAANSAFEPGTQAPEMNLAPAQVPGMQTLPENSPNVPAQHPAPAGNGGELLRTSAQEPLSNPATRPASEYGDSMSGGQGSDDGQEIAALQSGSQISLPARNAGGGAAEFSDVSLNSDFASEALLGGADSAPLLSAISARTNSSDSYGNRSAGPQYRAGSDALAMGSLLRAREETSQSQRLVRSPNPYQEIPSLYDMYLQAAELPAAVERFGMQVFENGTRDLQMIPMDLPAGPDYVLGSGDGISVDLWGGVSRRFYRVVDREGRVSLPETGPVLVAGKSLADVQASVQRILRTQFRDVSADVSLARLRTVRVYVVGDVVRPGAYDVGSLSTPLNALFAAGGPTGRGSLRIVKHERGNQLLQEVDVYDLLLHGVKGDMERLENGDTVMVPPLGPQVTVEGMVRRPAVYERKDEKSLAEAIALAGGLLPTALLRHIEVERVVAHEKKKMLSLDIPEDDSSEEATRKLQSFVIEDGDKIRIFPIAPYAQDAVYLKGHVVRPGKYSFHEGMRVTELIGSYKDLLPEAASQYGEIIRLSSPDFRPTVESFNLAEALANPAQALVLQALDTVQIFGRYDFENPPVVSVLGDVRAPGTYRTAGDIHLSDAIHLAGGLTPEAETADAQVFRSLPDSTLKILNVRLDSALEGSPRDNIVLSSRDRVLVHKNVAAADPATVYIKGEVARPGRYPLTGEMHVSDLVHAAGGLKQSADPVTADLIHYLWQDDRQMSGKQEQISLTAALAGEPGKNSVLSNGDVLSIRQLPGWEDLGASITLRGEVVHPGSYGIRPGEKLSSVLLRAGGFGSGAYPYGVVLARSEVQKLEQRTFGDLIQRVREQQASLKLTLTTATDPDQKLSAESALEQWQTTLDSLVSSPPAGRVTIQISGNIKAWQNTPRDVAVRAGDVLTVPKRPSYVLVQGQVFGPTAVAYRPGKSARWYLEQAGGPTNLANKKAIFAIRADGTVVGKHGWAMGDSLNVALAPGDMVVVPERALGGPPVWKAVFQNAQVVSSVATSAFLAASAF